MGQARRFELLSRPFAVIAEESLSLPESPRTPAVETLTSVVLYVYLDCAGTVSVSPPPLPPLPLNRSPEPSPDDGRLTSLAVNTIFRMRWCSSGATRIGTVTGRIEIQSI